MRQSPKGAVEEAGDYSFTSCYQPPHRGICCRARCLLKHPGRPFPLGLICWCLKSCLSIPMSGESGQVHVRYSGYLPYFRLCMQPQHSIVETTENRMYSTRPQCRVWNSQCAFRLPDGELAPFTLSSPLCGRLFRDAQCREIG